ncbi:MAG: SRSO17 transposase [Glomeribacter sp. 1016415]|nr:SRSO17 transposase [Glomeribacter sp. 1016415]
MAKKKMKDLSKGYEEVCEAVCSLLSRSEIKGVARDYIRGLLSHVERKNGWQLAEESGHTTPYAIQHLLGRAKWDAEALRDKLIDYVRCYMDDGASVLVLDETGFIKKGRASAGVARQYSGTAGRIENCQIGVFLTIASSRGATLLDRRLYIPESWFEDRARCQAAHIPDSIQFATKIELAQHMLEHAIGQGIQARWVLGDAVYGNASALRQMLEQCEINYVLGVSATHKMWVDISQASAAQLIAALEPQQWQRCACGQGTKGPRVYDWALYPINTADELKKQRYLLARRSVREPSEIAYYRVYAPASASLKEIVEAAGQRWTIECVFESAKGEVGLDQYEVRKWHSWYRHITLAMFAHAMLVATRQQVKKKRPAKMGSASSLLHFKRVRGL